MDMHPSHAALTPYLAQYPRAAGALWQTYNDLVLAQRWTGVALRDLPGCARAALVGRRPATARPPATSPLPSDPPTSASTTATSGEGAASVTTESGDALQYVVPWSLAESLSAAWIRAAFAELGQPPALFLAITADDASVVYYKLSRGIVKPPL
jgi:tRNA-splicing endonuclease subunit Sen15